jgi:hypothetical protein
VIPEELYSQEEAEKLLAAHGISLSSEQPEDMLDR